MNVAAPSAVSRITKPAGFLTIPLIFAFLFAAVGGVYAQSSAHDRQFASWETKFRAAWQADSCVQQVQSWPDYYSWVQRFYYDSSSGWFGYTDLILSKVTEPAAHARIASQMQALGLRVASEWSKDNGCRRIDTFGPHGIQHFSSELQQALANETGDGRAIQGALRGITEEVNQVFQTQ